MASEHTSGGKYPPIPSPVGEGMGEGKTAQPKPRLKPNPENTA